MSYLRSKIWLVGDGGHGKDIEAIAQAACAEYEVIQHHSKLPPYARLAEPMVIVGINDPQIRAAAARDILRQNHHFARGLIHPFTYVDHTCHLGFGCVVGPGSTLARDVILAEDVHVGANCSLTRCDIGKHTTIAPGAVICGDVRIGERTMVGAGAVIKNLVTIGDNVVIGAGAVVVADVPSGMQVKGVPAR